MTDNNKLSGALTGMAVTAAAWWARYDDDTQRRLRNMREDTTTTQDMVRDMNSRGDAIRQRLPVVMDAQVGLALASKQPTAPAVIPSTVPLTRPDLATPMEVAIANTGWPPEPGEYDDRGLVKTTGELTTLFLAQTFEEVRAFIQSLVLSKAPSRDGKLQIYYAVNSFMQVVTSLKLTYADYRQTWLRLFGQPMPISQSHTSVLSPPTVGTRDSGIAALLPNGRPDIPVALDEHQNTDRSSKWRLVVGGAAIGSNTHLATFNFGSGFTLNGKPYKPTVVCSDPRLIPYLVTPTGFAIRNCYLLPANEIVEFSISVPFGDGPGTP